MIRKILLGIGVVIAAILVIAAFQPSQFRVSRSAVLAGSPAAVFSQINDLHRWEAWSPWAKLDPAMKVTFDGPSAGVGAVQTWAGNSKAGEGRMTILESRPNEFVRMKLEFFKPFNSTCEVQYVLKPESGGTAVTWTMAGPNSYPAKIFCLFMNQDKMIGGDFERGLAQLNAVVQTSAK
jgi:Polyketide cyclase / dehydrase and lipid transport